MAPENLPNLGPKSFGSFEKRAPGLKYESPVATDCKSFFPAWQNAPDARP